MHCVSQFCRICIQNDGKLAYIHTTDRDLITFYDKLKYCYPDSLTEETQLFTFMCRPCRRRLCKTYDFLHRCQEVELVLRGYVQQLESQRPRPNRPGDLPQLLETNLRELPKDTLDALIKTEALYASGDEWNPNSSFDENSNSSDDSSIFFPDLNVTTEKIEVTPFGQELQLNPDNPDISLSPVKSTAVKTPPVDKPPADLKPVTTGPVTKESASNEPLAKESVTNETVSTESETAEPVKKKKKKKKKKSDKENAENPVEKEVKLHPCPICPEVFNTLAAYQRHKKCHVHCEICGKTFKWGGVMKKHLEIHKRSAKYPCDVCDKTFERKRLLKEHRETHEEMFKCKKCDKEFTSMGNLKSHMGRKHIEKPLYTCNVCQRGFSVLHYLKDHQLTHLEVKPFSCRFCGRTFTKKHLHENHLLVHLGAWNYHCPACQKGFMMKIDLKKHTVLKHKKKLTELEEEKNDRAVTEDVDSS